MLKGRRVLLVILIGIFFIPVISFAHSGRTDSSCCHTCRTNCSNWGLSYGEYHCHRAKSLPQPKAPIKSKFGENGTGYTQPAPEYENPSVLIPKNTNKSQTAVN